MRLRTVGELANHLLEVHLPQKEKTGLPVFVKIESTLSVEILIILANTFKDSAQLLSIESVQPFCNFLRERWLAIRGTDAIYPHCNDSLANRCCIVLARQIANACGLSDLSLLMPTVKVPFGYTSAHINNFVLSDDDTIIDVITSLDDARRHRFHDFFYPEVIGNPRKQLSKSERDRVIHHSKQAYDYYYSFFLIYNEKLEASLASDTIKDRFIESMSKNTCQLTSTYNDQGSMKLVHSLVANINTADELALYMTRQFDKWDWDQFISHVSNEDLFRIMLSIDVDAIKTMSLTNSEMNFQKTMLSRADKALYKLLSAPIDDIGSEQMTRAYFFSMLAVYMRIRKNGPEYKSNMGYYIGSYLPWATGTYSKEQKLEVCDPLKAFLLSNEKLCEFHSYLTAKSLESHWGPLNVKELGMLTQQMIRAGLRYTESRPTQLALGSS